MEKLKKLWKKYKDFLHHGSKMVRILKYTGVILVFLVFLTAITAEITSKPSFCPTCHYMQPFYDSWKESKHQNITCVKCHFEPGLAGTIRGKLEGLMQVVKYISQSYRKSKPWAEIPDESCLQSGCHETRLLKGEVVFRNVRFNHTAHLSELKRNKKLRCTSCHSQIVQGDHMKVTPETCYLCHFKKSKFTDINDYTRISKCTNCHRWDLMTKTDLVKYRYDHSSVISKKTDCSKCHNDVVIGTGNVPKEQCFGCHWERYRLALYDDINAVHKKHISEHKVECNRCHLVIEHKINQIKSGDSPECNTCHPSLHSAQAVLYTGHGGKDVEDRPSPMYKSGLNCAGCHMFHGTLKGVDEVRFAKSKSCEECHGKGYDRLSEKWQAVSAKKSNEIESILKNVKIQINISKNKNREEAIKMLSDAEYNLGIVKRGKGVHNIEYSENLLNSSYIKIKKSLELISSNYKLPKIQIQGDSIPTECISCHIGINDVLVEIYGLKFSHRIHTVQNALKCFDCHSNAGKHGQLTKKKEECTSCHHSGKSKLNCTMCHEMQQSIYTGSYKNLNQPDVMSAAEVKCLDCHLKDGEKIVRPQKESCAKCHDANFGDKIQEWQKEIKQGMAELKEMIYKIPRSKVTDDLSGKISLANNLIDDILKDKSYGAHNYELIKGQIYGYKKIFLDILK
jgi:nitrate/TMAO reductase-like tetraheme cytochrome c subunit